MMKKNNKFVILLLCVVLIGNILTGCDSADQNRQEEKMPVHVVLIVQAVSTVPVLNLDPAAELIRKVCSISGSSIDIIVADGKPWKYASIMPEDIDLSLSRTMQDQILEERVQELTAIAVSAEAVNPESDLIKAIEMGARQMHSYQDGEKQLIVCGSCINTVQPLPMQEMILSIMDIEAVIQNLMEESCIVDLSGINISLFYLGDTCGMQQTLPNQDKICLKNFWKEYLNAGHPESLTFYDDLPSEYIYEGLPEMSTVPVMESGSALKAVTEEEMEAVEVVSFDEQSIAFLPGSAELSDPDAASEAISVVAEYMKKTNTNALLVGTTARWGNLSDSILLSYQRAVAIKSLFTERGVDQNNLTVIGTGWLSLFYQNDESADGGLDENIAPLNRACIWVRESTELAGKIWEDEDFPEFNVEN